MKMVSNIQRKFFWLECSTLGLPTLNLRRTFRSITIWYNMPVVVIALKVRRNSPQCSNLAFKVRSIQKSHGWNRFWSRTLDVKDENLCYLFSSEKMSCCMKRSRTLEMVSNLQRKKFALNVRRDGPHPSICVRSFRSFTIRGSAVFPPVFLSYERGIS